jgi:hypothetical protein
LHYIWPAQNIKINIFCENGIIQSLSWWSSAQAHTTHVLSGFQVIATVLVIFLRQSCSEHQCSPKACALSVGSFYWWCHSKTVAMLVSVLPSPLAPHKTFFSLCLYKWLLSSQFSYFFFKLGIHKYLVIHAFYIKQSWKGCNIFLHFSKLQRFYNHQHIFS